MCCKPIPWNCFQCEPACVHPARLTVIWLGLRAGSSQNTVNVKVCGECHSGTHGYAGCRELCSLYSARVAQRAERWLPTVAAPAQKRPVLDKPLLTRAHSAPAASADREESKGDSKEQKQQQEPAKPGLVLCSRRLCWWLIRVGRATGTGLLCWSLHLRRIRW
jgi:hypothetical protein